MIRSISASCSGRPGRPDLAEREIADFLGALEERHEALFVEARIDVIEKRIGERANAE